MHPRSIAEHTFPDGPAWRASTTAKATK
jgi:hypothetical protein